MADWIVPLGMFAMVIAIIFLVTRKRERLALIEKGADASIFKMEKHTNSTLKWGLFLIGLGVGLIIAEILVRSGAMQEEAAYLSMIFLFGGIALLVSYFLDKQKRS
ncbi:MAG: hypothetical protein MUC31_04530 [Bacteroidales bacterium]|jgi:hypothetical protein|nr:hypothetical protein [Bacteroidales bacterium]